MLVLDAYKLAARLHDGQLDKAGRPYIEHLTRVFLRVLAAGGSPEQQIAALMHDSIEDGKATADDLVAAGVPHGTLELVKALTKAQSERYMTYLERVKAQPDALLIKIADVQDNRDPLRLSALAQPDAQRLRLKYDQAIGVSEGVRSKDPNSLSRPKQGPSA